MGELKFSSFLSQSTSSEVEEVCSSPSTSHSLLSYTSFSQTMICIICIIGLGFQIEMSYAKNFVKNKNQFH